MLQSELKFLVSERTAVELRRWARMRFTPDPHAAVVGGDTYQTRTLYFDTDEFDLFFHRGSQARAKFRIRAYNDGPTVFLERKLKRKNRVSKRRSTVTLSDLSRITGEPEDWSSRWFSRRLLLRGLGPVCQVSYSRIACVGESSCGPLRVTIDQDLRTAPIYAMGFTDDAGIDVIPGDAILELKYASELPPVFEEVIETFTLHPHSISKYRLAVRKLGLADDKERMLAHA